MGAHKGSSEKRENRSQHQCLTQSDDLGPHCRGHGVGTIIGSYVPCHVRTGKHTHDEKSEIRAHGLDSLPPLLSEHEMPTAVRNLVPAGLQSSDTALPFGLAET